MVVLLRLLSFSRTFSDFVNIYLIMLETVSKLSIEVFCSLWSKIFVRQILIISNKFDQNTFMCTHYMCTRYLIDAMYCCETRLCYFNMTWSGLSVLPYNFMTCRICTPHWPFCSPGILVQF